MPAPALSDSIARERDPDVPDDELTNVGKIRRALFNGAAMRPRDAAERFGGSNGLLGQVVYQLQQLGFHVNRATDDEGLTVYSVTNPAYQPTARDFEKVKKSPRATSQKRSKAKAASKALAKVAVEQPVSSTQAGNGTEDGPQPVPLPPLPGLGQSVSIYAQVLNDDGSITVGLKNGVRKWSVTLEGVMEG